MSKSLPRGIRNISLFLQRLPGIGEKSANRLAFYFLRLPESDLMAFADNISSLKANTKKCKICMNLSEDEICGICADATRNRAHITVVDDVIDLLSMETCNIYQGLYHVLHGRIDPLNHIGPENIFIDQLFARLDPEKNMEIEISEIILATNPDMEGEATAMYIKDRLEELKSKTSLNFTVSRLGYGMPMGGNLEYADYMTLRKALENRRNF
jgi:recombination protein RecR